MKKVFVVTGLDLGWDCIVGVFDPDMVSRDELKKRFGEGYIVHVQDIETSLEIWED